MTPTDARRCASPFVAAALAFVCAACGGDAAPRARATVEPSAGQDTAAAAGARAADAFAAPALVATLDLRSAIEAFRPMLSSFDHLLGLPDGTLGSPEALGIDVSRRVVILIARPDEAAKAAIARLRPLVPTTEPRGKGRPGLVDTLSQVARGPDVHVLVRLVVPIADGARTRELARQALTAAGARGDADDVFVVGAHVVRLVTKRSTLHLDFDLVEASSRDARDRALFLRSLADDDPPAIAGEHDAGVTYDPVALADLGFVWGTAATANALAGADGIDAASRDAIGAQGLWEASRCFALVGTEKGPYFTRVALGADVAHGSHGLTAIANIGPAYQRALKESLQPSPSIAIAGAKASIDASVPLLAGWPLPGGDSWQRGGNGLLAMAREAGAVGMWLAAPHAPVAAAMLLLQQGAFGKSFEPSRFERVGAALVDKDHIVTYGILPKSATQASAECVLSAAAGACNPRLKAATNQVGSSYVRLTRVDDRWVVLAGARTDVEAKLSARRDAPALFGSGNRALVAHELTIAANVLDGTGVVGDLRADGDAVVMSLRGSSARP